MKKLLLLFVCVLMLGGQASAMQSGGALARSASMAALDEIVGGHDKVTYALTILRRVATVSAQEVLYPIEQIIRFCGHRINTSVVATMALEQGDNDQANAELSALEQGSDALCVAFCRAIKYMMEETLIRQGKRRNHGYSAYTVPQPLSFSDLTSNSDVSSLKTLLIISRLLAEVLPVELAKKMTPPVSPALRAMPPAHDRVPSDMIGKMGDDDDSDGFPSADGNSAVPGSTPARRPSGFGSDASSGVVTPQQQPLNRSAAGSNGAAVSNNTASAAAAAASASARCSEDSASAVSIATSLAVHLGGKKI